jgi:hypothetical protein
VVFHHPYKHQNPPAKKKNTPMNIKIHQQKEKLQEIVQQVRNQLSTLISAFVDMSDAIIYHVMASVTI